MIIFKNHSSIQFTSSRLKLLPRPNHSLSFYNVLKCRWTREPKPYSFAKTTTSANNCDRPKQPMPSSGQKSPLCDANSPNTRPKAPSKRNWWRHPRCGWRNTFRTQKKTPPRPLTTPQGYAFTFLPPPPNPPSSHIPAPSATIENARRADFSTRPIDLPPKRSSSVLPPTCRWGLAQLSAEGDQPSTQEELLTQKGTTAEHLTLQAYLHQGNRTTQDQSFWKGRWICIRQVRKSPF